MSNPFPFLIGGLLFIVLIALLSRRPQIQPPADERPSSKTPAAEQKIATLQKDLRGEKRRRVLDSVAKKQK